MNYRGSYRRLLGNSIAAMIAAIEIYNKPTFSYRDECAVVLIVNAWELFLKALLSKKGKSVFCPKERGKPYRSLPLKDAFTAASRYFPAQTRQLPTQLNLDLLGTYRNNVIHFYNAPDFGVVVYALAQTSIKNFRDLLEGSFGLRLETLINWRPMPIGIEPPIDVVSYIAGRGTTPAKNSAVRQFLAELASAKDELIAAGEDTGRLMTIFNVKLESVKKIGDADVVVGIDGGIGGNGPLVITRTQDPNKSHPLRRREICQSLPTLHGSPFTTYIFNAVVWKYELKTKPAYCWQADEGVLTKYSRDTISFIKHLSQADLGAAVAGYKNHHANLRRRKH